MFNLLVNMRGVATALALCLLPVVPLGAHDQPPVALETLLKTTLEIDENIEVSVSYIEIGPQVRLPVHYHPGEEFVYVLEGNAVLWQRDKPDTPLSAGQVYKVPLGQVHTASTGVRPARAIVFRVHRKGEPERILVEE